MSVPRVLVPRPAGSADALVQRLRELGLAVDHQPFLALVPVHDDAVRQAVADLRAGCFSWLVLTSATALPALELDTTVVPRTTRVAVVGDTTAAAARERGIEPCLVAAGSGQALVEQMPPARAGDRVLWPASSAAAPTVPDGLRGLGYEVRPVTAYRPTPVDVPAAVLRDLAQGAYAVVVLTSAMIARLVADATPHPSTRVVSIGDPTSQAAHEVGLRVDVQADAPTIDALAAAVVAALPTLVEETP